MATSRYLRCSGLVVVVIASLPARAFSKRAGVQFRLDSDVVQRTATDNRRNVSEVEDTIPLGRNAPQGQIRPSRKRQRHAAKMNHLRERKLAVWEFPHDSPCNSPDDLHPLPRGAKLIWFFRHGQSIANQAKDEAHELDLRLGGDLNERATYADETLHDAPLSAKGKTQCYEAQGKINLAHSKPSLIVSSPLIRAIQTAAIIFERQLMDGNAKLKIRPELRELHAIEENKGHPLPVLRNSSLLKTLATWSEVQAALSEQATNSWEEDWNERWANGAGGAWQMHTKNKSRFQDIKQWLANRREKRIAVVSHLFSIHELLDTEPWSATNTYWSRSSVGNAEWIAVAFSPKARETEGQDGEEGEQSMRRRRRRNQEQFANDS